MSVSLNGKISLTFTLNPRKQKYDSVQAQHQSVATSTQGARG